MKLLASIVDDGFDVLVAEGGDRVRFVEWKATSRQQSDTGKLDISMAPRGHSLPVFLGWRPDSVILSPLRDPTPGMHQPFLSHIPQGVAVMECVAETGIRSIYEVLASQTGQPYDTRSMGNIPTCDPGSIVNMKIIMRSTWTRLFIKKMDDGGGRLSLSRFRLTVANGEVFHSMAHLIKPEGNGIVKFGKDGIVFSEQAPRWCYANIAFQSF